MCLCGVVVVGGMVLCFVPSSNRILVFSVQVIQLLLSLDQKHPPRSPADIILQFCQQGAVKQHTKISTR